MRTGRLCTIAVTVALLATSLAASANPKNKPKELKYTITAVQTPGFPGCEADFQRADYSRRLNESAQIAGHVTCYGSTGDPAAPQVLRQYAYTWSASSGPIALQPVEPTAIDTLARDINETGTIVGWELLDDGYRAPMWSAGGGVTYGIDADDCFGFLFTVADGVNDQGSIAGSGRVLMPNGSCSTRWILKRASGERFVGPPGRARDVNNNDMATGISLNRPIRWSPDTGEQVLSEADGITTQGITWGINDRNEVVGEMIHQGGDPICSSSSDAKFWAADGTETTLPPLPGKHYNTGFAINGASVVVGYSTSEPACADVYNPENWRASMWRDGAVYDLNDLIPKEDARELQLIQASDINERGQILVRAIRIREPLEPCPFLDFDPVTGEPFWNTSRMCHNEYSFLLTPKH